MLFSKLLAAAELNGIRRFRAWVLADNRRMLDLITRFGEVCQRAIDQAVVELSFTARPAIVVGKLRMNVVPSPGRDCTSTVPPCSWMMP